MKNSGKGSKKVQRRIRAEERKAELATLSPQEKEQRLAQNKAEYDSSHKS